MSSRAESGKETEEVHKPSRATQLFIVWRKLKKSKLAVVGLAIVFSVSVVALLAPVIAPYGPLDRNVFEPLRPPASEALLGADDWGRDVFSLILYGARISLYVGLCAVFIELVIGMVVGMIAGYFGGKIDEILMRSTDVFLTLPTLPLLILAVSMFEVRSIHVIVLVMGVLGWPWISRYVRSEFLSLKEATFVEAARSMGATNRRIIVRHILPNVLSTIIVLATMDIPWFIFYEATLSFLGFGDPSSASWGVLLERGYIYLQTSWWIITFPGLALFFTSLGFNLFGDALRDALDVKSRL